MSSLKVARGVKGGSRVQPDPDKQSGIDPLVQSRAIHVMQQRYEYAYHDIDNLWDHWPDPPGGVYDLGRVRSQLQYVGQDCYACSSDTWNIDLYKWFLLKLNFKRDSKAIVQDNSNSYKIIQHWVANSSGFLSFVWLGPLQFNWLWIDLYCCLCCFVMFFWLENYRFWWNTRVSYLSPLTFHCHH